MTATTFLPLAIFTLVSTITPGGATTLATASGAHFGYRRSMPLIAGIATGLASMGGFAAAGLGGLLLAAPALQILMKAAGSLYLLWLAVRIARSPPPKPGANSAAPIHFLGGLWMLWHNPKAWSMTAGAAASFTGLAPNPLALAALLAAAFLVGACLSLSFWCIAGQMLGRLLRTEAQWRRLNFLLGLLLLLSIVPLWVE
jgi:threonine/homoserine/homoserine lactone efflux protein